MLSTTDARVTSCGRIIRMRAALLTFALAVSVTAQRASDEPFVGIGVWYAGPGAQPPATALTDLDALRTDLTTIRRAGFNAITAWTSWRESEPQRGAYALGGIERLAAAAAEADLKVQVIAYTDPAPAWATGDAQAAARFVSYLSTRMSLQRNVVGVLGASRAGESARGRIAVRTGGAPDARLAMWSALARGERYLSFAGGEDPLTPAVMSLGETAGVVTRNQALFAPLRPRAAGVLQVTGADPSPAVEVRLLESGDALMIIGVNHAPRPQKVTIAFSPEMPEAIWQNLETGTAVNFVMGKTGPTFDYTFGPRDALVLMIRKKLR